MEDQPDYSISELLLSGLLIAGAVSSLIWAGYSYFNGHTYDAMEGSGISLLLFAGCADPLKYFVDSVAFPLQFTEPAGRETNGYFHAKDENRRTPRIAELGPDLQYLRK